MLFCVQTFYITFSLDALYNSYGARSYCNVESYLAYMSATQYYRVKNFTKTRSKGALSRRSERFLKIPLRGVLLKILRKFLVFRSQFTCSRKLVSFSYPAGLAAAIRHLTGTEIHLLLWHHRYLLLFI